MFFVGDSLGALYSRVDFGGNVLKFNLHNTMIFSITMYRHGYGCHNCDEVNSDLNVSTDL